MPGLVPGTHAVVRAAAFRKSLHFSTAKQRRRVDTRDARGHDGEAVGWATKHAALQYDVTPMP